MNIRKEKIEEIVHLLKKEYPDWSNFNHPKFVKDEIDYKQSAASMATELLDEKKLLELHKAGNFDEIIARIKKVGNSTNLLWNWMPSKGDLGILEHPGMDKGTFCREFIDLIYGRGQSPDRLEKYLSFVKSQSLPNKWTFPTYFLFLSHPQEEMFVKPRAMKRFLEFLIPDEVQFKGIPSSQVYNAIRQVSMQLKEELKEYGPKDMIDIQSAIYLTNILINNANILTKDKSAEFKQVFREFAESYLSSPACTKHIASYEVSRDQARKNLDEILKLKENGDDITEHVITKLLPYADSDQTRNAGYFLSTAWVFRTDARKKLEGIGFVNPSNWPLIAEKILEFVVRCDDDPEQLPDACTEFSESPLSKGFQTGTLTPILSALHPDQFVLINNKSRRVLNYFTEKSYSQNIADYPKINETALTLLKGVSQDIREISKLDLPISDIFDMFSHWCTAIRSSKSTPQGYSIDMLATDISKDRPEDAKIIGAWINAIHRKGQAILYGPPGTGKTYLAEHLARHLISGGDGFVELVQFHPAYAYEDFMQGIRPQAHPQDGTLEYSVIPGRFLDFCRRAEGRGICVLIIDEINRANLARVFGELMYLLEYRDREIPLSVDGQLFSIPENVRIIGTMNTADRSIALVDHALRRRFAFIKLHPDYEVLGRYHQKENTGFPVEKLIAVLQDVNRTIKDPNYEIGISFFIEPKLMDHLEGIWKMEIEPYLEEYFFDSSKTIEQFRWEKVKPALGL